MQKTKWTDHKFTTDEIKAQRIYRRGTESLSEINNALKCGAWTQDREQLHKRLDQRLDAIDKGAARAKDIFPEVDKSFTMYRMQIDL